MIFFFCRPNIPGNKEVSCASRAPAVPRHPVCLSKWEEHLVIYILVKRNAQLLPLKAFHTLLSNFCCTPVHLSPSHPFLLRPPPTPALVLGLLHTVRYSRVSRRSGLCVCVHNRSISLQIVNRDSS